jgi:glyceraldehyde 3-phosphate dehydrogenase
MRVAINGFGRIGRAFLRAAWHDPEVEIVALNDLGEVDNLAYLLKHDSVYRDFPGQVGVEPSAGSGQAGCLVVGAKRIPVYAEKDPAKLPWKDAQVDVVVESTGVFDSFEKSQAHLVAGARKVVISAPVKDAAPNSATVLVGVNEEKLSTCTVTSNASCTTNSASPLIAILDEALGIDRALLNTVHAYTATQSIVDSPVKGADLRRGRAAAQNITPSSTGAAVAVTKAYPQLSGKFDGIAIRVPVPAGSIVDITFIAKRDTTAEEVNKILSDAAATDRWKGIFAVSNEPLVSSDIIGSQYASVADLEMTRAIGNLVKVMAWYDNEMGYAHTLLRHVKQTGAPAAH